MNARIRRVKRLSVTLTAVLLLGGATACSESSTEADGPAASAASSTSAAPAELTALPVLVGNLSASTTKLGIYVDGDKAWGYLCDPAAAAIVLTGTVDNGALNLTEADGPTKVTGAYAAGSFTGTVLLNGTSSHDVSAITATGEAGVFIHYSATADITEIGAWIRDTDGDAVGNVTTITDKSSQPDGDVTVTEGSGDIPADAVPFALGSRVKCFFAARAFVKANQQPGGASIAQRDAMNRACGEAFANV